MVLEDVTELYVNNLVFSSKGTTFDQTHQSDYSGANTKLSKILLNGNNICMVFLMIFSSVFYELIHCS